MGDPRLNRGWLHPYRLTIQESKYRGADLQATKNALNIWPPQPDLNRCCRCERPFDGQLNDDYSIEVLVYRKSLKFA